MAYRYMEFPLHFIFSIIRDRTFKPNIKISKSIKEIQKNIFCQWRPWGEGKISIFFIIRDRTLKLKNQIFNMNLRNSMKYCLTRGFQRVRGAAFLFSLLLVIGLSNLNINISILFKEIQ